MGSGRRWRTIAGIAVLAALCAICAVLFPPYIENWKLQQYLNDLGADSATAGQPLNVIRANVVDKANGLGLPVHASDVQVSHDGDQVRIQVLYIVRVNLAIYSVDLHFRPAA